MCKHPHLLQVVEQYTGHDSIAYGADWYKGQWPQPPSSRQSDAGTVLLHDEAATNTPQHPAEQQQQHRDIVATCSFYDRRLHLWSPKHSSAQVQAVSS